MDTKEFHPHTPSFSGGRMRMNARRVHCEDSFSVVAITHEAGGLEACRFYLPYLQGKALIEAAAAFNAVMDAHEAVATAPALDTEAA